MVCEAAMESAPVSVPLAAATASRACWVILAMSSAKGSRAAPAAVREIFPPVRLKSAASSSASSALICWVTAGCVRSSSSAALRKFSWWATVRKTRRRKFSMGLDYAVWGGCDSYLYPVRHLAIPSIEKEPHPGPERTNL